MVTEIEGGPLVPTNTNDNEDANGASFFLLEGGWGRTAGADGTM